MMCCGRKFTLLVEVLQKMPVSNQLLGKCLPEFLDFLRYAK